MKLTQNQESAIYLLREEKSICIDDSRLHKNTMNSLYFKGLVKCSKYGNGEFWELTDKGLKYLKK